QNSALTSRHRHTPSVRATSVTSQALPTPGLVIPRNKSWKDIVEHWLVGDPDRGLNTPLKDWPKEWYQGANRWFASKYYWRATMALEFVNQYHLNEAHFLAAYPEAELRHTQLLKAVNEARVARGERVSRRK
ncbi:hypothetical protein M405DRAFT_807732, partial [Rhizopogon salebrosus TDB-379]